jgi:hypothetical protein
MHSHNSIHEGRANELFEDSFSRRMRRVWKNDLYQFNLPIGAGPSKLLQRQGKPEL